MCQYEIEIKELLDQAIEINSTQPEAARDLCLGALKIARENDNEEQEGKVLLQLIKAYRITSAHEKALDCIDRAKRIFVKYNDDDGMMRLNNLSGILYFYIGMYELAVSQLDASYKTAEKLQDKNLLMASLNNIAEVKKKAGDSVEALRLYKHSLELAKEDKNSIYYGVIIQNIGDVHRMNGELEKAESCYFEAFACYKEEKSATSLSELYINFGKLYLLMEQPERASAFFDNAIDMLDQVQNKFYILDGLIEKYKLTVDNEPIQALDILKRAAKLAEEAKITLKLSEIELLLNKHYERFKNFERALYHFKRHHNILQKMDANNLILKLKVLKFEKASLSSYESHDSVSEIVNEEIEIERKKLETLEEINQKLTHQAYHDNLTGLANRRKIDMELERISRIVEESTNRLTLGIFMLDIDHFKLVNDNMGHIFGDACLEKIGAELIRIAKKHKAFVGRYGGEEFVLIKENTNLDFVRKIAEDLLQSVRNLSIQYQISGENRKLTISVGGIHCTCEKEFSKLNTLDLADRALYVAKSKGRNQAVVNSRINNEMLQVEI